MAVGRLDAPGREEPMVTTGGKPTPRWYDHLTKFARQAVAAGASVWSRDNGVEQWRTIGELLVAGMVKGLQVGTTAVAAVNATAAFADTGLSATITPTSADAQILAVVLQNGVRKDSGDTAVQLRLLRGAATIGTLASGAGRTGAGDTNDVGTIAGAVLDAPGVTTALTYKTQFASESGIANARVQFGGALSALLLFEVAP